MFQKMVYSPVNVKGFRKWYRYVPRLQDKELFLVDFETVVFRVEDVDTGDTATQSSKLVTKTGILIYFVDEHQNKYRAFLEYEPYFYLLPKVEGEQAARHVYRQVLKKIQADDRIKRVQIIQAYDSEELTFPRKKHFIKVTCRSPGDVPALRDELEKLPGVKEWREADVLFHHRTAIDNNVRIGYWYRVSIQNGRIVRLEQTPRKDIPPLKILAYDIEVKMDRARDPNLDKDPIMMIAAFTGEENVVIIAKDLVDCTHVRDFYVVVRPADENNPLPYVDWVYYDELEKLEASGIHFVDKTYVNAVMVDNEKELLTTFYDFVQKHKPDVFADFYGDRFDIPFLYGRSKKYGLDFLSFTGFSFERKMDARDKDEEEFQLLKDVDYVSNAGVFHLDAFLWTQKYSYLPKSALSLKASVKKRLKIQPIEREALWAIDKNPAEAVAYAGSDGYITWRYVKEIILDFCISMGQMFPIPTAEILTKRAGSLDDLLIDAIGYSRGIIGKKRFQQTGLGKFTKNLNLENVAFTGGLVEARNIGVWRSDIPYPFNLDPTTTKTFIELTDVILDKTTKKMLNSAIEDEIEAWILKYIKKPVKLPDTKEVLTKLEFLKKYVNHNITAEEQKDEMLRSLETLQQKLETLYVSNLTEEKKRLKDIFTQLTEKFGNAAEEPTNEATFQIVHVDVTSMYPSQIRQYKIQPSGIVTETQCKKCIYREPDNSCMFDAEWTLKFSLKRPCPFKENDTYCQRLRKTCPFPAEEESSCTIYNSKEASARLNTSRSQEFVVQNETGVSVYIYNEGSFKKIDNKESFFLTGLPEHYKHNPKGFLLDWITKHVPGTTIGKNLPPIEIDINTTTSIKVTPPKNTILFVDVRSKNAEAYIPVQSRICQKAYEFVSDIMDQFFKKRVFHKKEAKRLKRVIKEYKKHNEEPPKDIVALQKFHDSTQLGLKVPLNSIYGLLGMKGGVRNASTPCAGITTRLSAELIKWTADLLDTIGYVTELDTDGVWVAIPTEFPTKFSLTVKSHYDDSFEINSQFPLLEYYINHIVEETRSNRNVWRNSITKIEREIRSFLRFEQDGPYDLMVVLGRKKYAVYRYDTKAQKWEEEEITGLETKRQDFSELIKKYQQLVLEGYQYRFREQVELKDLYRHVLEVSVQFLKKIKRGELDIEDYVIPKGLGKLDYKSVQPQVVCAEILKEIGITPELGMTIKMLLIKSSSSKKSESVIPLELIYQDMKVIQRVLKKRGINTLGFLLGNVTDVKSLLAQILDVDTYIDSIFGDNRIFERMVVRLMKTQNILIPIPKEIPNSDKFNLIINEGKHNDALAMQMKNMKQKSEDRLNLPAVKQNATLQNSNMSLSPKTSAKKEKRPPTLLSFASQKREHKPNKQSNNSHRLKNATQQSSTLIHTNKLRQMNALQKDVSSKKPQHPTENYKLNSQKTSKLSSNSNFENKTPPTQLTSKNITLKTDEAPIENTQFVVETLPSEKTLQKIEEILARLTENGLLPSENFDSPTAFSTFYCSVCNYPLNITNFIEGECPRCGNQAFYVLDIQSVQKHEPSTIK